MTQETEQEYLQRRKEERARQSPYYPLIKAKDWDAILDVGGGSIMLGFSDAFMSAIMPLTAQERGEVLHGLIDRERERQEAAARNYHNQLAQKDDE